MGFGIVIPLLPLYAERFGASPVAVTCLVAIYSLMQFFFAPWWGRLSDRRGRRPVLLVGLFGSALSYLLFGLAGSLLMLFLARALAGFMGANIGVAQAYVADVTPGEGRAKGMGMIGAAFGLGFIFGPALGGILATFGPSVPFFGAAALTAANGALAIFWLPESLRPEVKQRARTATTPGVVDRLRSLVISGGPRVRKLYGVFFLVTFAFAALEATLSLWADRRWSLTPSQVAYMFAYLGVVVTIVQGGLVGPLARRLGERRLAVLGGVALGIGLAGIPLARSFLELGIVLAILALGQGLVVPALSTLISREGDSGEYGSLMGVSQSLSALGRVLGPVWGGIAFARLGYGAPYFSGALVVGIALVVMLAAFLPVGATR